MSIRLVPDDPVQARLADLAKKLQQNFPRDIDLSLGRMNRLLDKLGNPHLRLPPTVHIAGTNGKGSTAAFCRAIAEASGRRVHVYTSPHLVRFNERIRLSGQLIADDDLLSLCQTVMQINGDAPITFFEVTTAMAFLAFAEHPADLLVLETGMGGRLDATNVVPHPAVTIITPIGLDHQEFLGETIEKIAFEKACIQKPGAASIIGPQPANVIPVLRDYGHKIGAKIYGFGQEWHMAKNDGGFTVTLADGDWNLPAPNLPGAHQYDNAANAVMAMRVCGIGHITATTAASGLQGAEWPARLQRLHGGPVFSALNAGDELWLDGGHNPACGAVLANYLQNRQDRPWYLIFGMLANKDARGFLQNLRGLVQNVACIPIPNEPKAQSPAILCQTAADLGFAATQHADLAAAIAVVKKNHPTPCRILIAGSLYLAGHVLYDHF